MGKFMQRTIKFLWLNAIILKSYTKTYNHVAWLTQFPHTWCSFWILISKKKIIFSSSEESTEEKFDIWCDDNTACKEKHFPDEFKFVTLDDDKLLW